MKRSSKFNSAATSENIRGQKIIDMILEDRVSMKDIRNMLKEGADLTLTTAGGHTALSLATQENNSALVKELIDHGSPVNTADLFGKMPLMYAAFHGNLLIAPRLIAAGAKIHAKDHHGATPLLCAWVSGSMPLVDMLVKAGADIDGQDNGGATLLKLSQKFRGTKEKFTVALAEKIPTYRAQRQIYLNQTHRAQQDKVIDKSLHLQKPILVKRLHLRKPPKK